MGSQTNKIMAKLNNATSKGGIKLALDIHGGLVEDTPVDKGWAQNNWLPAIGAPKTEPVGTPDNVDSSSAAAGVAEVTRWRLSDGPIFITNNVPYIGKLNAGSSKQAPAGFVESAVQTATSRANRRGLK